MNYLTNYYKNLSEQLQEQVNLLESILLEAYIHSPGEKQHAPRMPGETRTQTSERRVKSSYKRSGQIEFLRKLAERNPEEYGDLYKRLIADVLKPKPTQADVGVGIQAAVEKSQSEGGYNKPVRAELRPGAEPGSGIYDTRPHTGYLTPSELRKIVKGIKGFPF
jgi:hypothetical protein